MAFADEAMDTTSADVEAVVEEVDTDNVVDAVEEVVDLTDENGDAATDEVAEDAIDEIVEEVTDEIAEMSEDEAAETVEEIEADITQEINALEDEAQKDPKKRVKLMRKMHHLKALLAKLRARLIKHNEKLRDRLHQVRNMAKVYEIRWGVLDQKERCPGVSYEDITAALDAGETPECDKNKQHYIGKVSVNTGELIVRKQVLFEKNDSVTVKAGSSIEFDSVISGHWDGLIVQYKPDEKSDEKLEITLNIGELNETFTPDELLTGRKQIGNGHMVEVKHLAQALQGVSKSDQNKLLEHKFDVQEKLAELRERMHRFYLLNKGGENVENIEEVIDEIGDYNFDEDSAGEIEEEIESALNELGDDASDAEVRSVRDRLKRIIAEIKAKAKVRKFAKKLIPFKDTDDDAWYTQYVAPVKDRGIISGYKDANGNELGEFRPANNITVAEILKIALETANEAKASGNPELSSALNHWAKGYVKKAEELGLDLVDGNVDLNRAATRGEVVRLVLEAVGIDPEEVASTDFSDVARGHKNARFIQYAADLGIVSGDDNASTFRPDAPINRAEAAKIANLIIEIVLGDAQF
ncbi:S-layer homology domain-containing protein [Patescibacteria group bacterium]|nr:S-layer homology domain-containing protein [Patescibacteria group bacterium]